MTRLLQIGLVFVVVAGVFAVIDLAMNPSGSPVRTTLRSVRDAAASQYRRLSGQPDPAVDAAAADKAAAPATPPARVVRPVVRPADASATADLSPTPAAPLPAAGPAVAPVAPVAAVVSGPPVPRRRDFYLPGRIATWTSYDVPVTTPLAIRAAGRVVAGDDASGPGGLTTSALERQIASRRGSGANARVMPGAPYLALIGRVCSGDACSEPFLVGPNLVLCPADIKLAGTLQLWTNNYVRLDGVSTALGFSGTFGGYSLTVEPAADGACASGTRRTTTSASAADVAALAAGQTLRYREYSISSSQSGWKPFFVPLADPLQIKASGTMQPRAGADPTGPSGIAVPAGASWAYPGARDVFVDADHRLYNPAFPYQALIGRLCGTTSCSPPFFVGTEHVVCPTAPYTERLELWVNHIIRPEGLLGSQTPLSLDAFELQTRRGAYVFELSRAASDACAP